MNISITDHSILGISPENLVHICFFLLGILLTLIFFLFYLSTVLRYRFLKIIELVKCLEETDFENLYIQDFINKPKTIGQCIPTFKNTFKNFSDLIYYGNKFLGIFMSMEKTETFLIIFLKKIKVHDYLTLFFEKSLESLRTYQSISIMFEITEIEKDTPIGKTVRKLLHEGMYQRIMNTQAAELTK